MFECMKRYYTEICKPGLEILSDKAGPKQYVSSFISFLTQRNTSAQQLLQARYCSSLWKCNIMHN